MNDPKTKTANLNFVSCSFISNERTGDYTATYRLREMVKDKANVEDIVAYLNDKHIPADGNYLDSVSRTDIKKHLLNKAI